MDCALANPTSSKQDQRTGVLDGTGDDALGPDNVTARMVLAPIKSARSRASSKLTLTNLRQVLPQAE
jgi:hypothetical protein